MKIAIIGSGISGLSSAYYLHEQHDITLFESSDRIGGHTATMNVVHDGRDYSIDTGFIVYNDWTYPHFIELMDKLRVESQPTEMSFSVSCEQTGLEYGGNNLDTLFAQRKNLLNLPYIMMLKDIVSFNKNAIQDLESGLLDEATTLGEYLERQRYGKLFASHYLIPMGSAIWSSTLDEMLAFPLIFFVRFFKNHGLLSVNNRPQWRVIKGGSSAYLTPLTSGFSDKIKLNSQIQSVERHANGVDIHFNDQPSERFEQVIFACHSDQALSLLKDATPEEQEVLGAMPYRNNEVILHTDDSILPKSKKAWSSWNYHLAGDNTRPATLSYNMNILQGIESETTFVVTLNDTAKVSEDCILGRYQYAHPVFTLEGIQAQQRWADINGVKRSWFCGAYWRNGFHEDGCMSGIRVANAIQEML